MKENNAHVVILLLKREVAGWRVERGVNSLQAPPSTVFKLAPVHNDISVGLLLLFYFHGEDIFGRAYWINCSAMKNEQSTSLLGLHISFLDVNRRENWIVET